MRSIPEAGSLGSAPHRGPCTVCCCMRPCSLMREGPTATTVCAPVGLVPRLKHVSFFCFLFSAGFSHLPNGLYPSYIPLSHLEPPGASSPLLAQLGQHSLFESQKGESGSPRAIPLVIPGCSPCPLSWQGCWSFWVLGS